MAGLKYMPVRFSSDSPGTRSSLSSLPEALVMAVSWLVQNHAMAPLPVPTSDCSGPPASTSTVVAASGSPPPACRSSEYCHQSASVLSSYPSLPSFVYSDSPRWRAKIENPGSLNP